MRWITRHFGRINWCMGILPFLMGCPFLYIGLSEVYKAEQMVNTLVAARGTVVDNVWQAFAHGGAAYVPVVEYQTRGGRVVRFTDGIGTYPAEYEVGAEVKVLYNPEDVQNARIYSWKRIWFAPTLITSIGMIPLLIGVVLALFLKGKDSGQTSC